MFIQLAASSELLESLGEAITIHSDIEYENATDYCPICIESMAGAASNDEVFVILECGHASHVNCIAHWMHENTNSNCPVCKNDLGLHDKDDVNQTPTRIVHIRGYHNMVRLRSEIMCCGNM